MHTICFSSAGYILKNVFTRIGYKNVWIWPQGSVCKYKKQSVFVLILNWISSCFCFNLNHYIGHFVLSRKSAVGFLCHFALELATFCNFPETRLTAFLLILFPEIRKIYGLIKDLSLHKNSFSQCDAV